MYRYDPVQRTYSRARALLLDGAKIVSLDERDAGGGIERIDLRGATVLPAFADCHVHLTDTGYFLGARDLSGVRTYAEFAAAVAAVPVDRFVLAGQYDESAWHDGATADAAPLELAFADAYAMLVRIDGHSSIVNAKTFAWLDLRPDVEGIERDAHGRATGKLFLQANWRAQSRFMEQIPERARRDAERRAAELALREGCLHLHAQLVGFPRDRYAGEIAALRAIPGPKWYPKICEPDADLARELGLPYVGGDVFLDGSIGSCTAAVAEPFCIAPHGTGALRMSDEAVYAYFSRAEELGISAGVHAIGDRAIEQCIATWERVLDGAPSSRTTRHFIEHFEIAREDHIERCARLGLYLSMQPQFDELWGGEGRMYDARLGRERMQSMNALARIERAGAVLCGGDDSPVCVLSPLRGMQAAVDHRTVNERLTPEQALTMYTYNAARFGHAENATGLLAPGYASDFVVLNGDPLASDDAHRAPFSDCRVLSTWSNGNPVFTA